MDVEFSEWPALYDLVTSGLINNIRQMALEIHTPEMDIHDQPHHVCTWSTLDTLAFMMRTLIELKNAGFHIFYTRTNHRTRFSSALTHVERYCCHDIHLVNLKHSRNRYWKCWCVAGGTGNQPITEGSCPVSFSQSYSLGTLVQFQSVVASYW